MKVVTTQQMKEIDNSAINKVGIPSIVLMENAAVKVVDEIEKHFADLKNKKALIFAGKGNNGGDALAVARHLHNLGVQVRVYILFRNVDYSCDAGINLKTIRNMGIKCIDLQDSDILDEIYFKTIDRDIFASDFIVDGIFGTGFAGKISGMIQKVIEMINSSDTKVISIDIPSGMNGTDGEVSDICVKAGLTVTLGLPKLGLLIHPGCECTGELVVADIGIPDEVIEEHDIYINTIDKGYVSKLLPKREPNSNKGTFGEAFIVTGSNGMTGSGCLTAKAALRVGAGLVYIGVPASLSQIYDSCVTETITIPLEDKGLGLLDIESRENIMKIITKSDVAAIGPGLSTNGQIFEIIKGIIKTSMTPLIFDADALNVISIDTKILRHLKTTSVLTPHPGEMARLIGISVDEVQKNRIEVAREFALNWKVVLVLKGSRTVIAMPDGNVFINLTGNSGLATAGTGDVLTGVITGLIAQGARPEDAAVAGAYLHGLAGDLAAADKTEYGMIAGDVVEMLPYAIKSIIK
ncbi:MAG: NAD(P)H-hydrate dehydratase [Clostridia bacterium]|jgi:NAD(P)H-hydrate epimerase